MSLKRILYILFCLFSMNQLFGQQKEGDTLSFFQWKESEQKYNFDFKLNNADSIQLKATLDSLIHIGYYTLRLDSVRKNHIYLNKGKMYKRIWVKNDSLFQKKTDWFAVQNLDSLVQKLNSKYSDKGYPFSIVNIETLGYRDSEAKVKLNIQLGQRRSIDSVALIGYEKLSKGFIKHRLGLKKGTIYNENELKKISVRMLNSRFIEEVRPPQTLFNPEFTTVYLYIKKRKMNYFDGILGFGNDDEGKFRFSGNVQLELNNNFNGLEQIRLHWIATADRNTTLNLNVKIPYLFQTRIGSETDFKMHKEDSVFVSTSISERLFYELTPTSNIGMNFIFENSNFVLDEYPELAEYYDDYTKTGVGLSYQYNEGIAHLLLEGKSKFHLLVNALNKKEKNYNYEEKETTNQKIKQYEVGVDAFHLFELHTNHLLKTSIKAYGLFSKKDVFSQNELYRIGGFNSLRGFNEESILANTYAIGSLEYRFMPNEGFYVSLFTDYAYVENKLNQSVLNLFSFGSGLSFLTKMGIFNISYAVGKYPNASFDFNNSKVHFGLLSRF